MATVAGGSPRGFELTLYELGHLQKIISRSHARRGGGNRNPSNPVYSPLIVVWLLMVTTKELGTYQPVDVLSMGDGVLGALVVTG
jgi:hypothetical protein